MDDLKVALTRAGLDGFKVEREAGRIIIRGTRDADTAAQCCAKVFGVAFAASAVSLPASMESVLKGIVQLARGALGPGQSFAIRTHRATASVLSRREIEIKGGSEVLRELEKNGVKVNLKTPDVTIFVDLAGDHAYAYRQRFLGPGGLPLSSQWRMLAVLDSGPLSVLAAYAMMRRGCLVELLIPISETIPSFVKYQQLAFAQKLRDLVTRPRYRAFTVDFSSARISSLQYVSARRLVRLASIKLAAEKRYKGVVFPDVSGEIATLQSGFTEENEIRPPIFRPLIGLENDDLIGMCREIHIPVEELLSQMKLETRESESLAVDLSKYLDEMGFEEITL
jgi:thiamine biosynthesis protein ThiI